MDHGIVCIWIIGYMCICIMVMYVQIKGYMCACIKVHMCMDDRLHAFMGHRMCVGVE